MHEIPFSQLQRAVAASGELQSNLDLTLDGHGSHITW